MSAYKLALIAAIIASVEARFGQEQIPVAAVQALDGQFGNSGQASTLAGGIPGSLLGATNPCDKLRLADEIVTTLGNDPAVISAAAGLVAAEQNFNPFATTIPNICGDASLPATEALRGITPKVDPAVTDAANANALSAQSLQTPFNAAGQSVAQVLIAQGFTNLAIDGTPNTGAGGNAGGNAGNNNNNAGNDTATDTGDDAAADDCNNNADTGNADTGNQDNANTGNQDNADTGNQDNANAGGSTGANGADFGLCDPKMDFQFGRAGRKADEGTFAPVDDQVGGQDALNPNIITERICNQLINVCQANAAARSTCLDAAAEVQAAGSRGPEVADLFNNALGL